MGEPMRLGDVLREERERRRLSVGEVAAGLGRAPHEYAALEVGDDAFEAWAPRLAKCAMALGIPTSRLVSRSGRARDAGREPGLTGRLIRTRREEIGLSEHALAAAMGIGAEELGTVERGESPLESYAPLLLRFAEAVDTPVFNLFCPCGVPLPALDEHA